jgi:ribokinase
MSNLGRVGKGRVAVVGSFAIGLTLRVDRFPVPGETVLGWDFDQGPGGKGSNQAVQVARMGVPVEFIGVVGSDAFGDAAVTLFADEGVGTKHLLRSREYNTGVGFIILDTHGENRIILDPGANAFFSPRHVAASMDVVAASDVLITQLEIKVETAAAALAAARETGAISILNPAPARPVPSEVLAGLDLLTPNQTEARVLLGRDPEDGLSDEELCDELLGRGVKTVVLTRGAAGALIATHDGLTSVPSSAVDVVDSTGAGDAFGGTLAAALAGGMEVEAAVRRATGAGALACTKLGVIPALPYASQLDELLSAR